MSLTQINKAGLDEIALDHVFTVGNNSVYHYTFQGEGLNGTVEDPTLYLTRGKTYRFEKGNAHPLRIQSTAGLNGTAYNTGVTNNGGQGTVIIEVQHDAPDVLYYQCTSHANMNGLLYITGALADEGVTTAKLASGAVTTAKIAGGAVNTSELAEGGVTNTKLGTNSVSTVKIADNAITTAKIADDAITTAKLGDSSVLAAQIGTASVTEVKIASGAVTQNKIGADAVNSGQIADNAVITAAIADDAVTTAKIAHEAVTLQKLPHGTSSENGKFLRANNGDHPTFESIPAGTTINSQADNRLITCSGTADTLNAESALIWTGTTLSVGNAGVSEYSPSAAASTMTVGDMTSGVNRGITIISHASQNGGLHFGDVNDDTAGAISYVHNGDYMRFFANSSQRANVTQHGITFGTDTAAANAIDDYEEGTWTPNPHGYWSGAWRPASVDSGTVGSGTYTKIGRLVYFKCYFSNVLLTANARGTYARIDGLPYTVANDGYGSVTSSAHSNAFANTNAGSFYLGPNGNAMFGTRYGSDSYDYATWKSSNFYLMLAGTYQAA